MSIKRKIFNINGIFAYTLLNFIDKGINFCVPIAILFLFNKKVYSDIEYIISTSLLISYFLDFGVKTYSFYDYRNRKEKAIEDTKASLDTILVIQLPLYCVGLIIYPNIITVAISLRAFFFSFQYIYSTYNRLIDSPYKSFYYSIPINIIHLGIAFILYTCENSYNIYWYIVSFSIFTLCYIKSFICSSDKYKKIKKATSYAICSIRYSWPIMLCLISSTYVQNLIKIYGYDLITVDTYACYSLTLRLFMLALLLHQSVVSYYQKEVFVRKEFSFRLFSYYTTFVFVGFVLVGIMWLILPKISNFQFLNIFDFCILCLYYFLLCIRSFLELFLMKYNQVKKIAVFTVVSLIFFSMSIITIDITDISTILLCQLVAELLNIVMVLVCLFLNVKKK